MCEVKNMGKMVDKRKKQIILAFIKSIIGSGAVILGTFYSLYWSRPLRDRDQYWGDFPIIVISAILLGIWIFIANIKNRKSP
jgi:hypothetical protein